MQAGDRRRRQVQQHVIEQDNLLPVGVLPALKSTILRPGVFASNSLFWWATAIRDDGVVRWPYGAAETAPVDDRDVAAVAARTLYQDGHAGGDYVLTGPESLSQAEQVSIIGDVLGRQHQVRGAVA